VQLLFGVDWQPGAALPLEQKFRVSYNEILALTKGDFASEKINSLQQTLAEQIREDEQLALKLQAEWNQGQAQLLYNDPPSVSRTTVSPSEKLSLKLSTLTKNLKKSVSGKPSTPFGNYAFEQKEALQFDQSSKLKHRLKATVEFEPLLGKTSKKVSFKKVNHKAYDIEKMGVLRKWPLDH